MTGGGLRGRDQARIMLSIAVGLDTLAAAMLLLAPTSMGGTMPPVPSFPVGPPVVATGIVLNVAGLIWMARLYPRDAEAHPRWWRFDRS